MAITSIDRATCRLLAADIEAALAEVGKRHGLQIVCKGGQYMPTSYTAKVECSVIASDGCAVTPEVTAFQKFANVYGLKPEDLGRTFINNGQTFTIAGLKLKATRMPILARGHDGRMFKFPAENVARLLARNGGPIATGGV